MIDARLRKLLVTIRAALLMAAKAIEAYLDDYAEAVAVGENDNSTEWKG